MAKIQYQKWAPGGDAKSIIIQANNIELLAEHRLAAQPDNRSECVACGQSWGRNEWIPTICPGPKVSGRQP